MKIDYCTFHETTHYKGHESAVCRIVQKEVPDADDD